MTTLKVCFFGSYEKGSLSETLKNLLESEQVEIIECQENVYSVFDIIKAYIKLLFKLPKDDYSFLIVPWRGIITLPLAKLITKKPILFFPYVSIYDTLVNDRKKFKPNSITAKFIQFVEKKACNISDFIILENNETINYFSKNYGINKDKFKKLIWAANENKFPPLELKTPNNIFNILYFGTFIPFHGVDVIVECANLLSEHKDIAFTLCGDGQTKNDNIELSEKYNLNNIEFLGHVPFSLLQKKLKNADMCLGVFGEVNRRKNSFPNKISQVLASRKSLITRDVPVMHEMLLENEKNCILTKPGDAQSLADAILKLKNDSELNTKISTEGYTTFKKITTDSWKTFWSDLKNLDDKIE